MEVDCKSIEDYGESDLLLTLLFMIFISSMEPYPTTIQRVGYNMLSNFSLLG